MEGDGGEVQVVGVISRFRIWSGRQRHANAAIREDYQTPKHDTARATWGRGSSLKRYRSSGPRTPEEGRGGEVTVVGVVSRF